MFKRLFFALIGLGAGVTLGIWTVHKLEETQRKLTPEHAARVAGDRMTGLGERVQAALAEGRRAAREKEAELRAVYGGGMPQTGPPRT